MEQAVTSVNEQEYVRAVFLLGNSSQKENPPSMSATPSFSTQSYLRYPHKPSCKTRRECIHRGETMIHSIGMLLVK